MESGLQLRKCVSEGHSMMTSMKPNHSNHLATIYKHIKAPLRGMLLVYNPDRSIPRGGALTNTYGIHEVMT